MYFQRITHKIQEIAQTDGKGERNMECFQVLEAGEGIEQAILRGLSARGDTTKSAG